MASVASSGASPLSGYEYVQNPDGSTDEQDENQWTLFSVPSSAGPGSAGFFPSPAASASLGSSWGIVGHDGHLQPSPTAASPLNLNLDSFDQQSIYPPSSFVDQNGQFVGIPSAQAETQFISDFDGQDLLASATEGMSDQQLNDLLALFQPAPNQFGMVNQALPATDFEIPQTFQSGPDVPPWNSVSPIFVMEDPSAISPSPPGQQYFHQSPSPSASLSPRSPIHIKRETNVPEQRKTTTSAPIAIRKVRGDNSRVSKKKSPATTSESPLSSSGSSTSSKFFIVTPDSVSAASNKPNPFECFEAMRPSQRGRKGPLADETKESALQVRRQGACFCCHARKVKCDKERPCRNCKKLTQQVPGVVCWRFQDFLPVLFPEFIRFHFKKDEMNKFITENIAGFTVDGEEKPVQVELFTGTRFQATLSVKAKFFTAKTDEVLQHYHMSVGPNNVDLQAQRSLPIGLEIDTSESPTPQAQKQAQQMRDEIRKKAREYINAIVREPGYAELVTDNLRHTQVPRMILRIVQDYERTCGDSNPMVKRALSIYAMHFVMTRHLCLTRQTLDSLSSTHSLVQASLNSSPFITPRVLSRQIKSVIDEMMAREMTLLFENFSKSLKPKSRREWAPCIAAFLVLCLFMESVETAADNFCMSENEISLRAKGKSSLSRENFALRVNRELEGLPFKQFAFQFHQIYGTHGSPGGGGGNGNNSGAAKEVVKGFNPLLDDVSLGELTGGSAASVLSGSEELGRRDVADRAALEMVWGLRRFVDEPDLWSELDFLTADFTLPNEEAHPYPRDVAYNYTGRLVSKFLLSFTDERYLF
ncbi:hypothetical protein QBC37DRAFT_442420 [Rhypophila decipiens]|uniref:Zn(2)-C6 fungal-type domain-containing protein n=1 Tax=Rhypophila decipiens TaxID=261697 RepID=A0AAN7B5E8_9PEZI|nr:hypothetical protein QBC37DRAFT_442420 [Rhypophila decipiens]